MRTAYWEREKRQSKNRESGWREAAAEGERESVRGGDIASGGSTEKTQRQREGREERKETGGRERLVRGEGKEMEVRES